MREVVTYHKNGNIHERYIVDNEDRIQGLYLRFTEDGKKEIEFTVKDDAPIGMSRSYDKNGDVQKEILFHDGEEVNIELITRQNDIVITIFKDKNNVSLFFIKEYNKDNEKVKEYTSDMFGRLVGEYREFHKNGEIAKRYMYDKNSKKQGLLEIFHENGQRLLVGTFKDDNPEGIFKLWLEDGTLKDIQLYKNNIQVENPVFIINDTIFTANEYITAYNAGNEEFKNAEVKGFENIDDAKKYLSSLKKENTKEKEKSSLDIDR